jgi:CRISPR-associated endonuclease Csn1
VTTLSTNTVDKAPGQPWTLGLDIGIASVGWAVLGQKRIIDLGVRCFDKAETPDRGEPLNLARRMARLMRRRLFRRAWRLTKLARLLKAEGLIDNADFFKNQPAFTDSVWQLRVAGLDQLLTPTQWSRVMYHLCKHRGFHWVSRADEEVAEGDAKSENGRVKKALAGTAALMQTKSYRSVAEMLLAEFPEAQRNKADEYTKAISRRLLNHEFKLLFEAQRRLGNVHANVRLELLVRGSGDLKGGLFAEQKPSLAGADLLKMLGKCIFEKSEFRAPKASFTAERHVWLTRLNNLRVVVSGESRALTPAERLVAMPLPYQAGKEYKYKNLRTALVKAGLLPKDFRFASLAYPSAQQLEQAAAKDPEEQVLVRLPAWHELRLAFKNADQLDVWQQISMPALEGSPLLLDQIGTVLSVFKDDEEVEAELKKLDLPQAKKTIDVLLRIRFDKFHALSLKALRLIVPKMEQGLGYDEAVAAISAYGHHSQLHPLGDGDKTFLPSFYNNRNTRGSMKFREDIDVPRNPVVLRALNQALKVVNALVKKYGSPMAVHIELARDLSRPIDERRDIQKLQEAFRDRNDAAKQHFEKDFGYMPKGAEFERWTLYREQLGQCAYSLKPLDLDRVLRDKSYAQVDHALPYSRSYDDSKNNKVLALSEENQNKGNRTPFEYLTSFAGGEDGIRWQSFVASVNSNKSYRMAKRARLLRKNFGPDQAEGFKDRNLNDTRYICRFFKNYVEQNLRLASDSGVPIAKRCVVVNGQLTAFLRARWGLTKNRAESDRHHALDAVVVAACSHAMVQSLANHARRKELEFLRTGFADPETGVFLDPKAHAALAVHFPEPWSQFRHELQTRLLVDDPVQLRELLAELNTYASVELQSVRPLFVSRAVRSKQGEIHEGTIRSVKGVPLESSSVAVKLTDLTEKKLDSVIESQGRNKPMVDALRARMAQFNGNAKKAFAEPFYKPSGEGKKANIVRSVKVVSTQKGGVSVRGGVAELGDMLGVRVYAHQSKLYIEPQYQAPASRLFGGIAIPPEATLVCSLQKNDYVAVTLGGVTTRGYFAGYEADGRMTLRRHDQGQIDREYFRKSVLKATSIERLSVSILGQVYTSVRAAA